MHEISPPESVQALDLAALLGPDINFWAAWKDSQLLGCVALRQLCAGHGEIKSMRTAESHRRHGVARSLLAHLLTEAGRRGLNA